MFTVCCSTRFYMLIDALLDNEKVRIRDASAVEQKLNQIINAEKDKLLVVSDFDYTLSRFHDSEGKSCLTTHGVFDSAAWTVSQELGIVLEKLKAKYLPIEFDPHMTVAEKIPHMEDWWRTSHEHIIKTGFTKRTIQKFVSEAKLELKEGAKELMLALHDHNVPLVIFSAGIGNVIDFFFQKVFGVFLSNVHIVSNMMKYDENDVAVAFSEPLIHTFCKNSAVISRYGSWFNEISSRTCVLLMGDSLGDSKMDVGLEYEQIALKIGFLNYNDETLLDKYLDGYDIVLLDDQTMHVPRLILNSVFEKHKDEKSLSTLISCRFESENKKPIASEGESVAVDNICENLVTSMSLDVAKDGKRAAGSAPPVNALPSAPVTTSLGESTVNAVLEYEIPPWAGRPPSGCHLDVMKGDQLIQKLMVDEKRAYFFGRNPKQCDFVVEHASCSRVHAVLIYHKFLQRFALIDMSSCHGTFIGKVRIEPKQPVFIDIASIFHFGASTRRYILRAKLDSANDDDEGNKELLPEEHELENLTEYNTALNRRIPVIPISLEDARRKKRPRGNVAFIEEETIINPGKLSGLFYATISKSLFFHMNLYSEDVDPTVGRFRNLVATAIISTKRKPSDEGTEPRIKEGPTQKKILRPGRVDDYKNTTPDLDLYAKSLPEPTSGHVGPFVQGTHRIHDDEDGDAPHKKKYAKESWPGRKSSQSRVLA
uniref:5'-nucleotidase n=1 Tax=Setaria digitata TaxID=48799 RepID=A0A915PY74_9BILA